MTKETETKQIKKTAPKKTAPKKAKEVEVVEEVVEVVEKPVRATRKQIDANALIPCRSTTHGGLTYISKRTGERVVWDDYDDVQDITMGELKNLYASSPAFINDVMFVIDDEEAVEALNLTRLYDTIFDIGNLEDFFDKEYNELESLLEKLPKGLKKTVASKAGEMVKNGTLDSRAKIKLVEEKLKVDLQILAD